MYIIQKDKDGNVTAKQVVVIANFQTTFIYQDDDEVKTYCKWKTNQVIKTDPYSIEFKASTEDENEIPRLIEEVCDAYINAYNQEIERINIEKDKMRTSYLLNSKVLFYQIANILSNTKIIGAARYIANGGNGIISCNGDINLREVTKILDDYIEYCKLKNS